MPWSLARKLSEILSPHADEVSSSPSTRFAFRLFQQLAASRDPNILFSPASVMLCLGMVRELASGETRDAMTKTLELAGLNGPDAELAIAALKRAFRERPDLTIKSANSLWCGHNSRVRPDLAAQLRNSHDAEIKTIDFESLDAVQQINAWVSGQTNGLIDRILTVVSPLAVLVAVNAVYFKGTWVEPFRRSVTTDGEFNTAAGLKKKLPMMSQGGSYKYYEDKRLQAVALPYKGSASMYVVLPAEGIAGQEFPRSLTSGLWDSWLTQLELRPGKIRLPRFKLDYLAELESALKAMGMERAFDRDRAEFDGIQTDRPPVWIDQVLHRAVAEVNEEGTEAAAATAVVMRALSAMPPTPEPRAFNMIVNRPFLVAIRDEETGTILFMGWIGEPQ
jgi:serine protease inhibitor